MSNIDKHGRQVLRYANFGVDMMEWDDGGYVKHSDYLALLDELEAKDKRIAELEAREVRLNDINDYLAEVHDKTLNRAFRLLAEGVRAGDVSAIRHAGINVAAAGKGE